MLANDGLSLTDRPETQTWTEDEQECVPRLAFIFVVACRFIFYFDDCGELHCCSPLEIIMNKLSLCVGA